MKTLRKSTTPSFTRNSSGDSQPSRLGTRCSAESKASVWEFLVSSRPLPFSQEGPSKLSVSLRNPKKLLAELALSPSMPVDTTDEVFGAPHTVVIETSETCSGQVLPRTRVYIYWDVDPDGPDTTYNLYDVDPDPEHGRGNEVDMIASTFSEGPSRNQSLYDVLVGMGESANGWRTCDIEYEGILQVDVVNGDDHTMSCLEVESEGGSNNPVANDGPFILTLDREDVLSLVSTTN